MKRKDRIMKKGAYIIMSMVVAILVSGGCEFVDKRGSK